MKVTLRIVLILCLLSFIMPLILIFGNAFGFGFIGVLFLPASLLLFINIFCTYKIARNKSVTLFALMGIISSLCIFLANMFEPYYVELTSTAEGTYQSLGGGLVFNVNVVVMLLYYVIVLACKKLKL